MVFAVAPHELLVLANRNEPVSVRIAQAYMRERQVPRQNLVLLAIERSGDGDYTSISRAGFTEQIWDPVQVAIGRGGLTHILAWVFSTHIPYRVDHDPAVSVQGLTFVRNQMPARDEITRAGYVSRLFAGPASPQGFSHPTQSFYPASQVLGQSMPIPSMALGYMGPRGNSEEEILAMLVRGRGADATAPSGTVYFLLHDDIRSRVREWQYGPVAEHLRRMGTTAIITNAVPEGAEAVVGVMMGTAQVNPAGMGRFVAGSVGEHLTSFGAVFDQPGQTKISQWIAAGAVGTAGTVVEPYAIWAKFPHARFYLHYRAGCTLIESFYQSLRMPLQTFLVGDPLTAPWAANAQLRIAGITEGEVVGSARKIDLHIQAPFGIRYARVLYMINGRIVGEGTSFVLDPAALAPGWHEFRAVAYRAGFVQSPVFGVVRFQIAP